MSFITHVFVFFAYCLMWMRCCAGVYSRTPDAEVAGSNPIAIEIFFRFSNSSTLCAYWLGNCDWSL